MMESHLPYKLHLASQNIHSKSDREDKLWEKVKEFQKDFDAIEGKICFKFLLHRTSKTKEIQST